MLVAAQAVAIALGALPVFWLAREHFGSEHAALGFALAYLLIRPSQWLTLNEFHPVALGARSCSMPFGTSTRTGSSVRDLRRASPR